MPDAVAMVTKPQIDIFLTDMAHDLVIEVADNGLGIAKEHEDRILEQGFSTKEGEHRGFGLALVGFT